MQTSTAASFITSTFLVCVVVPGVCMLRAKLTILPAPSTGATTLRSAGRSRESLSGRSTNAVVDSLAHGCFRK